MGLSGMISPLIGRDAELAELAELLGVRPPRTGLTTTPRAVLLAGDAGVGKTRLLTEVRDLAFAEGWQVAAGHCLDFADSALPYLPFSEVLGRLAADHPDLVAAVAEQHPALSRLQPGRRVLSGDSGDPTSVARVDLFEAMHALLATIAAEAPLLLVIEDAHWADHSTRDLISFLFSRSYPSPVGIVVSYRGEDLHRRHPLRAQVAEWSRTAGVQRLLIEPLTPKYVRALVRELHPDPLAEASVARIVKRAEGNAFFVEELVGATWSTQGIPDDLADLLLVRLDRIGETAQHIARVASVAGRRVSHDLLVEASGVPSAELDAAIRTAVESHVLVVGRDGSYSFRHTLLGEAVYDDLLPGERVRLHAAYAEALRDGRASGTAAELARHAWAAHDSATALTASIQAGNEAMAVGGPEEASQHYERALSLVGDPVLAGLTDVTTLVVKASDALIATGLPARAYALVKDKLDPRARHPDDGQARLQAAAALSASLFDNHLDWRGHAERALQLASARASADRARILGTYSRVLAMWGQSEEARETGLEALAMAEHHDLPKLASDIRTTLAGLNKRAPIQELSAALEEAAERAAQIGATNAELRALFFLGRGYQDRGDQEQAAVTYGRAYERARQAGIPWAPYAFDARNMHAQVAYFTGKWDEVLRLTDVSGEAPPETAEVMLHAIRAMVLDGRGSPDGLALATQLRKAWSLDGLVPIFAGSVEIDAHGRAGRPGLAVQVLADLVATLSELWRETFAARVRLSAGTLAALANSVPVMSAADRARYAVDAERIHAEALRVVTYHHESGLFWGPEGQAWAKRLDAEMLRWQWLTGVDAPPLEDLMAVWREAVCLFEEVGHVPETAWSRLRLASVLRASGDVGGARIETDLVRTIASRLGARSMLDELVKLGSTPLHEDAAQTPLTPREREILALVATGRSNGEVAKQLFISAKTVSVHVSNILAKLGAAGRTEASAIARRDGLI